MADTTDDLKARYLDELRRAKAAHDKLVDQARLDRARLFQAANAAGLSYYMISQLTRTDGTEQGYGQEFVRKVCQEDPRTEVTP